MGKRREKWEASHASLRLHICPNQGLTPKNEQFKFESPNRMMQIRQGVLQFGWGATLQEGSPIIKTCKLVTFEISKYYHIIITNYITPCWTWKCGRTFLTLFHVLRIEPSCHLPMCPRSISWNWGLARKCVLSVLQPIHRKRRSWWP